MDYGGKGRSLKLTHPRGNHYDLLQLALQAVALHHFLLQMNEISLDVSTPSHKVLLRDPRDFSQVLNCEVQEVPGQDLDCIVNSGFDDPLAEISVGSELSSIQPGLLPKTFEVLSFPKVSNLKQDIIVLDAHSGNVLVALEEKGQFKILTIDKKGMGVFLDVSLNFLNADGKGVSLIVPEQLDKTIGGLSIYNQPVFLIDEYLIVLTLFVILLTLFHLFIINLALLLIYRHMISTSLFAKTIVGFLIITYANAQWSISQIQNAFEGQFDTVELRSEVTIRAYAEFRQRLKENNISVPSNIENEKFGYDGEAAFPIYFIQNTIYNSKTYPIYILTLHSFDFSWISTDFNQGSNIGGLSKENAFLLVTINDFPYDLQEGITHWLVWSNHEIELDLVHQALKQIMSEQFHYYAFVNPHNKKSIPEIFHAQIFVEKLPSIDSDL